jgi:hypothetical protein
VNIEVICTRNIHSIGTSFPFFGANHSLPKTELSSYLI